MKFIFTKIFFKNIKVFRNQPNRQRLIDDVIYDFQEHLFDSRYYRKKLKWYNNIHELEVWGDVRIIVEVIITHDTAIFLNIWTHSNLSL